MVEKSLNRIKHAWDQFILKDCMEDFIDPIVAESWKRCKNIGVDYRTGCGAIIQGKKMDYIIEKNKELIRIAKPIMENLHSLVLGSGFVLVLTDDEGYILEAIGEENIKEKCSQINFQPGALWSEDAVGTNAIGTCLKIDRPLQVIGPEHYCEYHHSWTCSAAPIHGVDGKIIGVLDMSGSYYKAHKHTLGIVVAAAYSIENQISLLRSHELIETTIESISDGLIIADRSCKINKINHIGAEILGLKDEQVYNMDIRDVLKDVDFDEIIGGKKKIINHIDCNFYISNRRIPCNVKITPVITDDKLIGIAVVFKEIKYLHDTVNVVTGNKATYTFNDVLTVNHNMKKTIDAAKKFSKTKGCILIEGESGTGKELFAHSIHNFSNRRNGAFVAVNCASLPRELVESELFGYERGAFTGAVKEGKPGKFELADGGTIFLDEIGELPLDLQAKLLRVLDDFVVIRIGGKYGKRLDIRVIGATNRNLYEEVRKKNFREDLYYRLNVFKITIPPLRERVDDIEICANYFLGKLNKIHGDNKVFSKRFMEYLKEYKWKGNVRELENIIERAYYLVEGSVITERYLPDEIFYSIFNAKDFPEELSIEKAEKDIIIKALIQTKGHVIEAGKLLNMSSSSIYRKIHKYYINVDKYRK